MGLQDISKKETGGFLPNDVYNVTCNEVELTKTKKTDDDMFVLSLEISGHPEVITGTNEDGTPVMKDPNGRKMKNYVALMDKVNPVPFAEIVEGAGLELFADCQDASDVLQVLKDNMEAIKDALTGHSFSAKIDFSEEVQVNKVTNEPILNPVTQEPLTSYQTNVRDMFPAVIG